MANISASGQCTAVFYTYVSPAWRQAVILIGWINGLCRLTDLNGFFAEAVQF